MLLLSSTVHTRRISTVVKTSVKKQTNVDTSQLLISRMRGSHKSEINVKRWILDITYSDFSECCTDICRSSNQSVMTMVRPYPEIAPGANPGGYNANTNPNPNQGG